MTRQTCTWLLSQLTHPEMSLVSLIVQWRYSSVNFGWETSIIAHSQVQPQVCLQPPLRSFMGAASTSPLSLRIRSDVNGGNVSLTYNGASPQPCLCERKHKFLHGDSVETQPFWVTWQCIKSGLLVLLKRFLCSYASINLKYFISWSRQSCDVNYLRNL